MGSRKYLCLEEMLGTRYCVSLSFCYSQNITLGNALETACLGDSNAFLKTKFECSYNTISLINIFFINLFAICFYFYSDNSSL